MVRFLPESSVEGLSWRRHYESTKFTLLQGYFSFGQNRTVTSVLRDSPVWTSSAILRLVVSILNVLLDL